MQGGGELAAHAGLAGADFARDQSDAAQFDQVLQARLGLARGGGGEELVGLQRALEGVMGEAEVRAIH